MNNALKRFYKLIQPEKSQLYQVYGYAGIKGIISLTLPLGIQSIINLIQGGKVSVAWFVLVFVIISGIAFSGALQLLQLRITETIQQKIFTRSVFDFSYRIPRIKFREMLQFYPPELMNRFFEVPVLQKNISKVLVELPSALLQILVGLIVLSFYHPFFILFSFIILILSVFIILFTARKGLETSILESKNKYKVASWLEELSKMREAFKLSGNINYPLKKINGLATHYIESRESHFKVLKSQYLILLAFKIGISATLLLVGGYLVLEQQMNIGQFVAAEILILLIIDSSEKIILNFEVIYDVLTSIEKVNEITGLKLDNNEPENKDFSPEFNQAFKIEFNDIGFSYPGSNLPVFQNLKFVINPGEKVKIAGENGSGKTTLLKLIAGIIPPDTGNILINDTHFENIHKISLFSHIGIAMTNQGVFNGTFAENITLGREEIKVEDIQWAIKNVGLNDYIKKLPSGLNTYIELSGSTLPESIVNKVLIARSIVNRPKLLLLDIHFELFEIDERKKLIDFITDNSNNCTVVFISNDDYFSRKSTNVLTFKN